MLFNSFLAAGAACLGDGLLAIGDGSSGAASVGCRGGYTIFLLYHEKIIYI